MISMPKNKPDDLALHTRVRETIKSMNIDQITLAQKLEVTQTMISMALRGANHKTFLRLLAILQNEYNLDFNDDSIFTQTDEVIIEHLVAIRGDLGQILERIGKLEARMDQLGH